MSIENTLIYKKANNVWDNIQDVIDVIELVKDDKWQWYKNQSCKYINVRIDMRDGGCLIFNNNGDRINPEDLKYQWREK